MSWTSKQPYQSETSVGDLYVSHIESHDLLGMPDSMVLLGYWTCGVYLEPHIIC